MVNILIVFDRNIILKSSKSPTTFIYCVILEILGYSALILFDTCVMIKLRCKNGVCVKWLPHFIGSTVVLSMSHVRNV